MYSTSLEPGAKIVRAWQLSFRTDYGLPGYMEPDDGEVLLQLILTEGCLCCTEVCVFLRCQIGNSELNSSIEFLRFRTDSNIPGVEKIAMMKPDSAFLEAPASDLPPLDSDSSVLSC